MHRIWTAIAVLVLAYLLSGCVTGSLSGKTIAADKSCDSYKYRTIALVPPFGKLAAQANQYSYTYNPDNSWTIMSGQDNAGIDASGQIQALQSSVTALQQIVSDLAPMLKLLASGGIDVSGLFSGAKVSTDAIDSLEKVLATLKATKSTQ